MRVFWRHHIRRTTLISTGLAAILVGLFLARYEVNLSPLCLLLLPLLAMLVIKRRYSALGAVVIIGLLIGLWRGAVMYRQAVRYEPLYNQTNTFAGNITDDPSYDEARNQTVFHIAKVRTKHTKLPGRIQVKIRGDKQEASRGDEVTVSGKLRPPLGTSRQGSLTTGGITIVKNYDSLLESLRRRFFVSIHQSLPEPQSSIGLGYLIGLRVSIPEAINDQLALVGLTHIVAVSGYNLTIIVQAVRRLLGKKSAYQSVAFSLFLITGFVAITGGSAPINRAVVVSVFSLLAWYFGREFKPVLLLLLSGALTALANPLYIWGDPGWYLSFLAFTGILVLAPQVARVLFRKKPPGIVAGILLETCAAQLCTLPYSLYLFGGVSVIAPLANLLVLPLVPFIMLMVFVVGVVGMLVPSVQLLAMVPAALVTLQLWLVEKLSQVSWAHADLKVTLPLMIFLFGIILVFIILLTWLNRRRQTPSWEADLI